MTRPLPSRLPSRLPSGLPSGLPSRPRRGLHLLTATGVVTSGLVASVGLATGPASAAVPTCAAVGYTVEGLGGPNFYIDNGTTPEFRSSYTGYRVTNGTGRPAQDLWVRLSEAPGQALQLAGGQAADQRLGDLAAAATGSRFWYLTAAGTSPQRQVETLTVYSHNPALPTSTVLCQATGGFDSVQGTIAANANKVNTVALSDATPRLGSRFTITVTGETGTIGDGIANDMQSFWMSPSVAQDWPANAFRLVDTSLRLSPDGTAAATTTTGILRKAPLGPKARPYTATYTFQAVGFTAGDTTVKPVQEIASGTQVKHTGSYPVTLPKISSPVSDLATALHASPGTVDADGGQVGLVATVTGTAGAELDSFVLDLPVGATYTPGSGSYGGVAVADPVLSGGDLVFPGPFEVTSPASALTFDVDLDGSPGPRTISVLGTVGPSYVGTDATVLDGSKPATATVSVDTAPTADDVAVTARSGADTTVDTAGAVHDADGDALTLRAPGTPLHGTARLVAGELVYRSHSGYTGPDSFTYTVADGRGTTASGTVRVTVTGTDLAPQTVDFPQPGTVSVRDSVQLVGTASSGLPVTWTSLTQGTCTVGTTGVLTARSVGDCTVRAAQPGNAEYAAAVPVRRTLAVQALPQRIDVTTPSGLDTGATVSLDATASSGLAVRSTSLTPETCSVDAGVLTALEAGSCSVRLEQPGDATWGPAPAVVLDVLVTDPVGDPDNPTAQRVTFSVPDTLLAGPAPYTLTAHSTSRLPVTVEVVDGPCTVDGATMSLPAPGECLLEARQTGGVGWQPAEPVHRTVRVVLPADDHFEVAPAAERAGGADLAVLANDPAGLTLHGVGRAGRGRATLAGTAVHYTPQATFGGVDGFTYEVVDAAGRTAAAAVQVRVPNLAPVLDGARTQQVAGTERTVRLHPADGNRDELTLTATTAEPDLAVSVVDHSLVLRPRRSVSGRVEVTATVTDPHGGRDSATVVDLVRPPAVRDATRTLTERGTRVVWDAAATEDARYEVRVEGERLCTTTALHCDAGRHLGPQLRVVVRVIGRDGTVSDWRNARPEGRRPVLVGTVYFDPEQSRIRRDQRGPLRRIVGRVVTLGFGSAALRGYTDSDGSWASGITLSKARTRTVAGWLRRAGVESREAWFGESDPAADNGSAAGKARNRRVEVWASYRG